MYGLYVAGRNECGQLGLGDTDYKLELTPTQFPKDKYELLQIIPSKGETVYLLVKDKKTQRRELLACGRNEEGQMSNPGLGKKETKFVLMDTSMFGSDAVISKVAAGSYHIHVLTNNQQLWSCGNNYYGQLGVEDSYHRKVFTHVNNEQLRSSKIQKICSGAFHTCILTCDNNLYITGCNGYGQTGTGTQDLNSFTLLATYRERVLDVFCGVYYTVILTVDRRVFECGYIDIERKQYPNGKFIPSEIVFKGLFEREYISTVAINDAEIYYLTNCSRVYVRGVNADDNFSFGHNEVVIQPALINLGPKLNMKTISSVLCPVAVSAALITTTHEVWVRGSNKYGELGLGHNSLVKDFTQLNPPCLPINKLVTSIGFTDGSVFIAFGGPKPLFLLAPRWQGKPSQLPYTDVTLCF